MKRRILAVFTSLLLVGLCGCQGGQKDEATTTTDGTAQETTTQVPKPIDFVGIPVRTDGYHEGVRYPSYTVITTNAQLEEYYAKNKDLYNLERRTSPPASDSSIGFLNAADKYDDAFFATHTLVLVLLQESSGSVRHEVTKVSNDEGVTEITVRRDVPQIGTTDMAQWHIFVELPNTQVSPAEIRIVLDTNNLG